MSQTILLVEDDSDLRVAMVTLLEAEGFEVVTANDGLMGLKQLERIHSPCLILLDWWLPLLSGNEFLSRLRGDPVWQGVPVVVLTASEAMPSARVEGFLRKPFTVSHLLELVYRQCSQCGQDSAR
ncbi:MAG TPA: response regulator [Myxococcaceae bacterium]|nr:response regulator [Myxococcaceae bacterium]